MPTGIIVKVQLPIAASEADAPALIYAKGRRLMSQQHVPAEVREAMKGQPKAFMRGQWNGVLWSLDPSRLLPDPGW